ncbi:MAG: DUF4244 domain-containing protein [Actinomycetota bacterium]
MEKIKLLTLRAELGQTTAEYALLMLAAAAIVGVLITWAGNDSNGLADFFSKIVQMIVPKEAAPTPN